MGMDVWNTREVGAEDCFDYYRDSLCANFASLTPQPSDRTRNFSADLKRWDFGDVAASRLETCSHEIARTRKDLASASDDNIYLNYVLRGSMKVSQGGHRKWLRAGDYALIDNAKPFEAELESPQGHNHLAVQLPRALFNKHCPNLLSLENSSLAPLLNGQLQFLAALTAGQGASSLAAVLRSLSALCAADSAGSDLLQGAKRAAETTREVKALISTHFGDPDLCLDGVARHLDRPKRTIQAHLSQTATSFSELLKNHRLLMALSDLKDRTQNESIEAIALRNGFRDATSLYRNFKSKYGCAPGAVRAEGQNAVPSHTAH